MEFFTKDSGERKDFDSGMRRDTDKGKPRFDLTIPEGQSYEDTLIYRWAMLARRGADKYGFRNWELANSREELDRFKASAHRHFLQWISEVNDGEDHAAAILFNVNAVEFVKQKLKKKESSESSSNI
jgi:acetyl-CoA acetyltransferase